LCGGHFHTDTPALLLRSTINLHEPFHMACVAAQPRRPARQAHRGAGRSNHGFWLCTRCGSMWHPDPTTAPQPL